MAKEYVAYHALSGDAAQPCHHHRGIAVVMHGAILSVLALFFSGCAMVGPDFEKPETSVNEKWSEADNAAVTDKTEDHREWWTGFNDPTLNKLIQTAYEQNLSLQIAGLRVHESRALLGLAAGTLYPQVQTLNASASSVSLSENAEPISSLPPAVGNLSDTSFNVYRVGVDAAWELDFWGRFRRGVESADANLAANIANYDDFLVTLTGEVAKAYVLLRTLEERLTYAQNNVAIQQRSYEIADVRFRNGLVTELDVQLARTLLNVTKASIPEIEAGIRQTKLALGVLLGMQPGQINTLIGEAGKIPDTPDNVAVGIPADLLRRRPDIRQRELQAATQSARIGVAQADLYPSFRLIGSLGYAADSSSDLDSSDSGFGLGVISFNWNFLNYGRLRNRVRVEDARYQQAITAYQNTVLEAAREVEDGLVSYVRARETVGYLSESVESSRRSVELAQAQYRDGIISYTLVLDAQQFLVLNEDRLTKARGSVATNLINTYKALGGGWQIRDGKPFIPVKVKQEMGERTNWGELLETNETKPVPADKRGSWRAPDM